MGQEVALLDLDHKMGLFPEEGVLAHLEVVLEALGKDLVHRQWVWDHQVAGVLLDGMDLNG